MNEPFARLLRKALTHAVLFGLVPAAYGATLYAANNGVDSPTCGTSASPCRSITRALANAASGDTIQVRPGVYSADLDSDGAVGEPGEETPSFGAMLTILKPIIVLSTDGAAATVIDARNVSTNSNVLIVTGDAEFGRPDHGFTVTNTSKGSDGFGMAIQGVDIKVRGNQLLNNFTVSGEPVGTGIQTETFPATVLIEGNQVVGWGTGIQVRGDGNKVSKNHLSMNFNGILASRGSVVGNVVSRNGSHQLGVGVFLANDVDAVGNAIYGNSVGLIVASPAIQKNNIFSNGCGLRNNGNNNLSATGNYWGAATGPGFDPADEVCEDSTGTTVTTPFATARFAINPSIEP